MFCQLFPLQQEVGNVLSQTLPSYLLITLQRECSQRKQYARVDQLQPKRNVG
jgi:hypothetical protein